MKRISIFIREEDHAWLKKVSKRHDRAVSDIIRHAIEDYRIREDQPIGSAYVPLDISSPDCHPSDDENKIEGIRARLESLEKFVFDRVITTHDLPDRAHFIAPEFLPEYMKK